ncbi:ParA family protein [Janibacter corallicola]|uniref:ParA family protein n=1 Tax=Janibacter corallicola TaxID=415212 RepID=UPI00082BF97C|nr:ParA family protein [Janibacter corallicola]
MTVYTVALSKGGSTKTTTAAEVVAALTRAGRRVLAIDLDHQGTLSQRLGVDDDTEVPGTAAEVLTGQADAGQAAVESPSVPGAHVLVGTYELNTLETKPEVITALKEHLPEVAGEWDDVVIDTPPGQGLVTLAALAAAEVVIAAVATEGEAYDQVARLEELIEHRVAPRLNRGCRLDWIVPTRHDGRRLHDRDVLAALREDYGSRVTGTVRETVTVRDAYLAGRPVSLYAPAAEVSADYAAALEPIVAASTAQTPATAERQV